MSQTPVIGLILAGGMGRRMGGADKGLVALDGRPMVAHVIERFAPQVDRLLINANRNADTYAAFGLPVVSDRLEGYAGPLAGLDAGLHRAAGEDAWVVTCPCDSPFVPTDLVARLRAGAEAAGAEVAMARAGGFNQPVFLLARTTVADALAAFLASGERKIDRWVFGCAHAIVDFDDCPEAFANINTPEELATHRRS
ncbi:molybdenum cofactor guanylyltransferase [Nitrogeniibacter mangrovi]|uniref:Molybdenum cofactor guanylyltransferase n=1 Tax=Nitrogeniibacter mangrovi TaxID=2016596 RepID=A0A6C1AY86_9RHOO|nr:molybdenum cofactor guanylyltransferase MobA [Nitrogeniibacter mangrovi]QID16322.1 molybdenum cofactor guanylyltransferase [Nitrogeniibacter mangrovi]